jgi:hypothetical protein
MTGEDLVVKAENAIEKTGKMVMGVDRDNESVLDEAGERAHVSYVWCPDEHSAAKGDEDVFDRTGAHRAIYELKVTSEAAYYPWVRVWWQDGCGNSMTFLIESPDGVPKEFVADSGTYGSWVWLRLGGESGVQLPAGTYRFIVQNREDGARFARLLLTRRPHYKPQGAEG